MCAGENLLEVKCFVTIHSCSAFKKKKKSKESPFSSSPYTLCCFPRALFSSFCQVSDCAYVIDGHGGAKVCWRRTVRASVQDRLDSH